MTSPGRRGRGSQRARARRLLSRALVVLTLTAAGTAVAAPAWAINIPNPFAGSCKSQPQPQAPGTGISGYVEVKPSPPPAAAPAFGANATSTEYVQYGYAGLFWSTYDSGCVANPLDWYGPTIDTAIGNWLMGATKAVVAIDNSLHSWASDPTWMAALTPLVGGANSALYRALFVVWVGAALLTVGISVGLRAHRSDMPGAVTLATWALFVVTLVAGAVAAPAWAGEQAASLMGSTLNALDEGFAGPSAQADAAQAHASLTVSAVLYPAWLRGEFGDPTSAAAQKYGAVMFQDQSLSWSQAASDPGKLNAIIKAERAQWGAAAGAIQKSYPQVYSNIQGTGSSRTGAGIIGLVTAVAVCGYDLIASLVVILALLGVQAGVVMLPALSVVGIHHRMRHLISMLGSRIFGMLINAVLWAAAAGVDDLAARFLLTHPAVSPVLALLVLLVLPIALWMITRVVRGRPAVPRIIRRAAMLGLGYAAFRGGARAGARQGVAEADAAGANAPMWYTDPWTWRQAPPGGLPPGGGGGGGGGGPLPPPGGGGGRPLPLPPPSGSNGGGPGPSGGGPNGGGPGPSGGGPGGGGPGPSVPPSGDGLNGGGPGPSVPPSGGGLNGAAMPPGLGTGPGSGPREYTGAEPLPGSDSDFVPVGQIFAPGQAYDDRAGVYDGGTTANARPQRPAPAAAQPWSATHRRPRPRREWSQWLLDAVGSPTPCGTCGGSGRGGGGAAVGTICPGCRGWGY
jgi:hypothetical protein